MNDIDRFCEAKSDQLNNIDLVGTNRTIIITKVKVTNTEAQGVTINYEGDNGKPWKPCKTTARIMKEKWGNNIQNWVGKSVELFRDPEVLYGGKKEGGIRIFGLSDIPADFETVIRLARSSTKIIKIRKLISAQLAAEPIDPALIADGDEASSAGVAAYTAWKDSLTPENKASIKPYHAAWSAKAKQADAEGVI